MAAQPTVQSTVQPVVQPIVIDSQPEAAPAAIIVQSPAGAPDSGAVAPDGSLALIAGYLNVGVGLVLLAALGMYITGFGIWITHLKVSGRDGGIEWMESAVRTLFYLIILMGIVRFAQYHTKAVLSILAIAIILLGGWAVISAVQASGGGEDEH